MTSMYNTTRMPRTFVAGVLAGATPVVIAMDDAPLPSTLTLKSAAAGRKIELSTDGGTEYFTPAYDQTTATMLIVSVTATVSHVRFTGQAADAWRVQ